jgi:hypothetical protein
MENQIQAPKKPTRITLDHPVTIQDAVSVIMQNCGGDCTLFGNSWRETPEGKIPYIVVLKTTSNTPDRTACGNIIPARARCYDTSSAIYSINPNVVCNNYNARSREFTISAGANLTTKTADELRSQLLRLN